jgi:polysaccharide pyruvyl transferase WcaK-like protein
MKFKEKNKDILTIGYYGQGNIGDDLMYYSSIRSKENIYSLKTKYKILSESHISNFTFIKKMFFEQTELIFSGGNIFNISSFKSYFKFLTFYIILKFRFSKKQINTFHSVGFNFTSQSKILRYFVLCILNNADFLHVRDLISYRFIRRFSNVKIVFKPDSVFTNIREIKKNFSVKTTKKSNNLTVVFISSQNLNFRTTIEILKSENVKNTVMFFCQSKEDVIIAKKMISDNDFFLDTTICKYEYKKLNYYLNVFQNCKQIITERYHGAVLAEAFNVPWYMSGDSEKLKNIFSSKTKKNIK